MNDEMTFATFGQLRQYASLARRMEESATVNAYDAATYWAEMARWAGDCATGDLDPGEVVVMETVILSKMVLRSRDNKKNLAINAGHIATRCHRIGLLRTLLKNAGLRQPKAVEAYIDATLAQAEKLKPARRARRTA